MSSTLSTMLHLNGLPPLPRSLTGFAFQPSPSQTSPNYGSQSRVELSGKSSQYIQYQAQILNQGYSSGQVGARPSPPVPPPRPHSRRSSSSGSSFRASPEHASARSGFIGATEGMRCSPRSLSSSPHSPHIDSGLGRSSADSFSEPRAFVRVVKSPPAISKMDVQLSQLKKDMNHLRSQDMALLGHLLQIHQGIQDLKNVLVPPPQPAPTVYHPTPSYAHQLHQQGHYSSYSQSQYSLGQSRYSKKLHNVSRAARLFTRRASADKAMTDSDLGACGGLRDAESDSLSSLEFGDV